MKRIIAATTLVVGAGLLAGVGVPAAADAAHAAAPVNVKLTEMAITPSTIKAKQGKVTFRVTNAGKLPHEFVVIKTNLASAKLPMTGSVASEKGNIGETGDVAVGQTKVLSLTLKKGTYVVICNVAGHYAAGMRGSLVVR